MLRERSRNTSCQAFQDGSASSGASQSFAIHAEYKSSVVRFQLLRNCQTLLSTRPGPGGFCALTTMSRVMVPQPPGTPFEPSVACHVPAAGSTTSANQE